MAQAYKIEIDLGFARAVQGMQQVARQAQQLQAIVGGGGGVAAVVRAASPPSNAQVIRQNAQLMNAQASHMRAQLNLQRASNAGQSSGFVQRLGTFARSTRYGQGGFMPLLGRSLDLVGAKGGGVAVAVMAAVAVFQVAAAAVKAFSAAIKEGTDSLNALRSQQMLSGGTAGQTALLHQLGIGDIAGTAAAFRQRLVSDPMAMMMGMNAGIGPQIGRAFGSQNEAGMLQKAIDHLRALGEGEEQLRQARTLQLDSILPLINVSRQMAALQKRDAAVQEQILRQNGPAAREFAASLMRLGHTFEILMQAFAGPGLGRLTGFINYLADSLLGLARVVAANPQLVSSMIEPLIQFTRILLFVNEAVGNISKGSTAQFDAYIKAATANTTAVNANTAAQTQLLGVFKSGIYGGGARAGGAIPQSLRGYALMRAQQGNSLRLGAFTI